MKHPPTASVGFRTFCAKQCRNLNLSHRSSSDFSARFVRVMVVFADHTSSRSIRCCAFVSLAQRSLARGFFVRRFFSSSGRSSDAKRIMSSTVVPVSRFAFLHSGSGKSIHQQLRSSQRFKLRLPRSTPLIVPSMTGVLNLPWGNNVERNSNESGELRVMANDLRGYLICFGILLVSVQ